MMLTLLCMNQRIFVEQNARLDHRMRYGFIPKPGSSLESLDMTPSLRTSEEKIYYYCFMVHYLMPFLDDIRVIVDWTVVSWRTAQQR